MKFRLYKSQYRQNLLLAGPVVMSQMGQVLVQMVDSAMVGRLGSLPLAAVSFGSAVFYLPFILGLGVTLGATPLVGEAYAQSQHRKSASFLQNSIVLYTLLGVGLSALMFAIIPLMSHMGQPQSVVDAAIPYYKYLAVSMMPFMLFGAFKQFLEGLGNTKVVMYIVLSCNALNVLLNYIFIYGSWGCPEMGVAGAGFATMISRICMPVALIVYFYRQHSFRRYFYLFDKMRVKMQQVKTLLRVGTPISIQMVLEGAAFTLCAIMMGWIGETELAANQVAMSITSFAFMILIGVGSASTIRVSHEYGQGNISGVRMAANASYHIILVVALVMSITFVSLRNYIPQIFTSDPAVIELASNLLIIVAMFQFCDAMQFVSLSILRGLKDVDYTMKVALVSYIIVNIPIGYTLAFVFKLGAPGLWGGYIFGLGLAAILLYTRYRKLYRSILKNARAGNTI